MSATENENLEQQSNGPNDDLEGNVGRSSQNQVKANNIGNKIRRAVGNVVFAVENRMHDAILTAMSKVVIPRVKTAMRSITGSVGHGPNSDVQNPDRRVLLGSVDNTPPMSASSRLDLKINQDRNDETRNEEDLEDGDFPALRPNHDRRAHAHYSDCAIKRICIARIRLPPITQIC